MPRKSAHRKSHHTSRHVSQLSVQAWVAVVTVVVFLVVLFYQMMTHSISMDNPNFLTPDQQVKTIPLGQPSSPVDQSSY